MAAPVVGDDAIAAIQEEQHLRIPVIGRQRPAVAEHDGLPFAPVLVKDLNAVFGRDRTHERDSPFGWRVERRRQHTPSLATRFSENP